MRKVSSFKKTKRIVVLSVLVILVMLIYNIRLMHLQIVNGEHYRSISNSSYYSNTSIAAPRGEILDRYGRPLAVNTTGYSVVFDRVFLPGGAENSTILKLMKILSAADETWNDTLPISKTQPYEFLEGRESAIASLKSSLRLNTYSTAQNCMDALYEKYLSDDEASSFSEKEKRDVCAVRYEMTIRDFSSSNRYTFAKNISVSTATKIEELSYSLKGAYIADEITREYPSPTTAPHVIGVVGAIDADEYSVKKNEGYKMSDFIGKLGVEKAFESFLKGTDGVLQRAQDKNGNVVSQSEIKSAKPGNTVVLTIDQTLQDGAQKIIQNHAAWLRQNGKDGKDVSAISFVCLDVSDGGVLALANYPSFSLNEYYTNYFEILSAEGNPLFNRATSGLYRPGSTFKTIVSSAGLCEKIIEAQSIIQCNHKYTYYDDYQPTCLGTHGNINVISALGYSCNIFFYEVGRRLGIYKIQEYASYFSYGTNTGIEIPEGTGQVVTPEYKVSLGTQWFVGDVLQAAIGQSDTSVTPLQMAVAAMTIANKGVRYEAHLLKEVKSYDMSTTVSTYEKKVASDISSNSAIFDTITKGMMESARLSGSFYGLTDYKTVSVAIKTGTPQVTTDTYNHCAIGFAPADNPQIAFAVMQEGGRYSPMIIKQFLQLYFDTKAELSTPQENNTLLF